MDYDKKAPGGMRLTPEQIMKRQQLAQTKKDEFQQLYQDAYEFALPQRQLYGVWEGGSIGSKKMQRVFDSTAINSTQHKSIIEGLDRESAERRGARMSAVQRRSRTMLKGA